jgi:hypothetical protein
MRKLLLLCLALVLSLNLSYAKNEKNRVILLISEQNIEGPQRAWWASEIDLSATENTIAQKLIEQRYEIVNPDNLKKIIKQDKAFREVNVSEDKSLELGKAAKVDYVVVGKALASAGGNVPQSNMRSCFANITAKLIRVNDGKVIAYLDAAGSSAHMDVITGGKEALFNAAADLAAKLVDKLGKDFEGGN